MHTSLRLVDTIWAPTATVRTAAEFVVEADRPGIASVTTEPTPMTGLNRPLGPVSTSTTTRMPSRCAADRHARPSPRGGSAEARRQAAERQAGRRGATFAAISRENGGMSAIRKIGPLTVIALQDAEGPHFDRREEASRAAPKIVGRRRHSRSRCADRDGRWWLRFRSFAIRYGDSGPVTLVDAGHRRPTRSPPTGRPCPVTCPRRWPRPGSTPAMSTAIVPPTCTPITSAGRFRPIPVHQRPRDHPACGRRGLCGDPPGRNNAGALAQGGTPAHRRR